MNRIGERLGNYRLTRLLGEGGFAEIYQGEDIYLGTPVAVKILHAQVAPENIDQFLQEARILASLKHPYIVNILDFGIEGRTPYLMMSYAPYGTLRTRHPRGRVLPISAVVAYVNQVAQALQYAHDHKIVHRDIKPENILIGEHGEVLLSDFGIALISESSLYRSTKDMVGTIIYMAPEQMSGHPCPASDQYALAIVVYEWLCGTFPFHGSLNEIVVQHSAAPPPPLQQHLPMLSPEIEKVVMKALAKRPEDRFTSVSAFAYALEQASRNSFSMELPPISFESPSPSSTTSVAASSTTSIRRKWSMTQRLIVLLTLLVIVSLIGSLTWFIFASGGFSHMNVAQVPSGKTVRTPFGHIAEFTVPTSSSGPAVILPGPDRNLWFTEHDGNKIGRISPQGSITEFVLPSKGDPGEITEGPDGNIWFTEYDGNKIGRISSSGVITEFTVPTSGGRPDGITAGPDGKLWFTERDGNKIGTINPGN